MTCVSDWYFPTPIFGLALGSLFLGETFGARELPGLAAVTGGIVLAHRTAAARRLPPE